MINYSSELHKELLKYEELKDLDNPHVGRVAAYGINAMDLSGIVITKVSEPTRKNKAATLVSITEIESLPSISGLEITNKAPETDARLVRVTDYLRNKNGLFSRPDQKISIYNSIKDSKISVVHELSKLSGEIMKEFLTLEAIDAEKELQDKCTHKLSRVYSEMSRHIEEEQKFDSALDLYSTAEHIRLRRKLGALVLYRS